MIADDGTVYVGTEGFDEPNFPLLDVSDLSEEVE